MTQAIALSSLLRKNGHEVNQVVVGKSDRRTIPEFFFEGIGAKVTPISSPNFVTDKNSKSVNVWRTIVLAFSRLGEYRKSVRTVHQLVRADNPDVIINFYDFIGGLYNMLKSNDSKFVCIAHQYLAWHSSFEFAKGNWLDKITFRLGNWLVSYGAQQRLALSFQEYPDEHIAVVPPLLRREVKELEISNEGHLLIYLLNHGYSSEVDEFHEQNPNEDLHVFWDKPDAPSELRIDDTLTYHRLGGEKFLKLLSSCTGYVTTAGFESVCEAMYLGKPVMMVPVQGHYEQACNALDGIKAGAGVSSDSFDLSKLINYFPDHKSNQEKFTLWCNRSEAIFLQHLTKYD